MAVTKDQERQALQQIRKIVEDLGEDSYIGMAFEGVWDIAEDNIENDFGRSCQDYIDLYHEAEAKAASVFESFKAKVRSLEERNKELEEEVVLKKGVIEEQQVIIDEYMKTLEKEREVKFDRGMEISRLKESLGFARREIVELKAKLYDLLIGGN